jgi:hypothetical protein
MKTPDTQMHHLLSAAAVTDCARTPIFAEERGELLREVTPQPAVHRPSQATTTSPSLEVPLLPKER